MLVYGKRKIRSVYLQCSQNIISIYFGTNDVLQTGQIVQPGTYSQISKTYSLIPFIRLAQSCPRVTFLGPDPTRRNVDPTRPDPRSLTKSLTRPDPRPDPTPICKVFNLIIIYLLNNYYILNIDENQSLRM